MPYVDNFLDGEPHPDIVRENAVHAQLAEIQAIATIWTTRDVRFYRRDLSEQQAWQVLQLCKQRDPGGYRMSWRSINQAADKLFGSKKKHRIKMCEKVLKDYEVYNSDEPLADALVNLLADAMHWCKKNRHDFHELLHRATRYYYDE